MWVVIATVIITLAVGAGYGTLLAPVRAGDVPGLASIHMINALTGWAVTSDQDTERVLRTMDGGTHWKDVTPLGPSGRTIDVENVAALTSLIAWVTAGAQIYHTVDGGHAWRRTSVPLYVNDDVTSLQFASPSAGWLLVVTGHWMANEAVDIYRTTDGGETWIKIASATAHDNNAGLPTGGHKGGLSFRSGTTGWITGMEGVAHDVLFFYATYDSGRTWRERKLSVPPGVASPWFAFTGPPAFFSGVSGVLPVFYGLESPGRWVADFYATQNGGVTWTSTTPVPATARWETPYSFADWHHGWVAGDAVLYATSEGGRRWTTMRPAGWLPDVTALDFISPQVGWASRKTSPSLLKTLDGGRTWTIVTYSVERP